MTSPPRDNDEIREAYAAARCNPAQFVKVEFPGEGDDVWSLSVERHTAPAWEAFATVMVRHDYRFRESAGGTYNCRPIDDGPEWSLHAYALAIDLNPSKNPHHTTTTDQPPEFRADLKALHTASGRQIFAWGGDWSPERIDTMHWEIGATPDELATGIIDPGADMPLSDDDVQRIAEAVWSHKIDTAADDGQKAQPARFLLHRGYLVVRQYLGGFNGGEPPSPTMLQRIDENTRRK